MKKAFSLIEIIITIVIISIVSTFAFNKFFHSLEESNFLKIKAEVALINNAINQLYSNQTLLGNNSFTLEKLDEADINSANETLFNGYDEYILLDELILSTSEEKKKLGFWIKLSDTNYKVYFSKDKSLEFLLDKETILFSCDDSIELCKEFNQ